MPGISSPCSARGVTVGSNTGLPSRISTVLVLAAMADGATGTPPEGCNSWCDTRPTCHNCTTMRPPAACTESVTRRQARNCSGAYKPGTSA